MELNSSTSSFNRWRWLIYLIVVVVVWVGYAVVSQPVAKWVSQSWGDAILAATKYRILDPERFVQRRCWDVAYLLTVTLAALAMGDAVNRMVRLYVSPSWRFVPLAFAVFAIVNAMCFFGGQVALPWMMISVVSADLRLTNANMSEIVLWESTSDSTAAGMVLGSSQANAQLGASHLNQLLEGDALFADMSYHGGHPFNVVLLGHRWKRYPDIAIWYLSILDIWNHKELGAAAQSLMNGPSEAELVELGADQDLDPLRMWYGRVGRWVPLFRVRRVLERLVFGVTGVPVVSDYHARKMSQDEREALKFAQFTQVMSAGVGDQQNYEALQRLQRACIRRMLDRMERHGTRLLLIAGHVHPDVEAVMPEKRRELLAFLKELTAGKSHVVLVDDELPRPTAEQYRDFTHLKETERPWYTEAVLQLAREKGILSPARQPLD